MKTLTASFPVISTAQLARESGGWLIDGECRRLSNQTLASRKFVVDKLLWFLRQQEFSECGAPEMRAFFAYVSTGHKAEGGRWGNPHGHRAVKDGTAATYYSRLRALFRYLVENTGLEVSPLEKIRAPINRKDQIAPFTPEQVNALLAAAKKSSNPRRNEAIVLLLLDTGMRASELCGLRKDDLDLIPGRRCTVTGKGNKTRVLYVSGRTAKAVWSYINDEERDVGDFVFSGDRARAAGEALTRSGLLQLFERLGKTAGIRGARCSPHTMRHTFAIEFLRAGGNSFSLQQLLGHTDLKMTMEYVRLAQADMEKQHRQFSPVDRLKGKGR